MKKFIIILILSLSIYGCTILLVKNNGAPVDIIVGEEITTNFDSVAVDVLTTNHTRIKKKHRVYDTLIVDTVFQDTLIIKTIKLDTVKKP